MVEHREANTLRTSLTGAPNRRGVLMGLPAGAATLVAGRAANGVPTGIQIVARTYDDARVFQAATAFERAQPWLDAPERRPGI